MSSRQIGTCPQLIGYALFEIWSLILDGELKNRQGYSMRRLSVQMVPTENQKIAEEVQNTWKGKLGRLRQMNEAGSGQKNDSNIQTADLHKVQVP